MKFQTKKNSLLRLLFILTVAASLNAPGASLHVRDFATIRGLEAKEVVGTGVVLGLTSGGDADNGAALAVLTNMLKGFGVVLPKEALSSTNIAAVKVMAKIPAFSKPGKRVEVTVAGLGEAKTLEGGILAMTTLAGADGTVYAVAQGPLAMPARSLTNSPATARIIAGAIVEKDFPVSFIVDNAFDLLLPKEFPARRVAESINAKFPDSSQALDNSTVRVKLPESFRTAPIDFIAQVQGIEVAP